MNIPTAQELAAYPPQPPLSDSSSLVLSNYSKVNITAEHLHVYKVSIVNVDAKLHSAISDSQTALVPEDQVTSYEIRHDIFAKAQEQDATANKLHLKGLVFDEREYAYGAKALHKKWPGVKSDKSEKGLTMLVDYEIDGFGCQFRVSVKWLRTYDLAQLHQFYEATSDNFNQKYLDGLLYALDSVVRLTFRNLFPDTKLRGCNFPVDSWEAIETNSGFDIWWGYLLTMRAGRSGLYLNISSKGVAVTNRGTLLDLARSIFLSDSQASHKQVSEISMQQWLGGFQNMVVSWLRVRIPGMSASGEPGDQVYSVKELTSYPASKAVEDGMPLVDFYRQKYGLQVSEPLVPCAVIVLSRGMGPLVTTSVPLEHCQIVERQRISPPLGWAMDELMRLTTLTPQKRTAQLQRAIKIIAQGCSLLSQLGMTISPELERLPAQVLQPPEILARDDRVLRLDSIGQEWSYSRGDGAAGSGGAQVVEGAQLQSWAVAVFGGTSRGSLTAEVDSFVLGLVKVCLARGINVVNTQPPIVYCSFTDDLAQSIRNASDRAAKQAGGARAQLVLCVLQNSTVKVYGEIKRAAMTLVGVQTQCVQMYKLRAQRAAVMESIALKINVKLGGQSIRLSQRDQMFLTAEVPTLVLSADVNHTTEAGNMSVAAVVASLDCQASKFQGFVMQHPQRMEYIENLDVVVRQALRQFYKNTGLKPVRIVYYRDGVNDSQLVTVKQLELAAIYRACELIEPGYKVQLTMLLVRKRHHARFVLEGEHAENCLPGTMVEAHITNPRMFSFYLMAHRSIYGVSKAPYYIVAHDDSRLEPQVLRQLTYNLCYTYPVVNRVVTMPACLYYAHKLTNKGRLQLNHPFTGLPRFIGGSKSKLLDDKAKHELKKKKKAAEKLDYHLVPVHENLQGTMYFI
ncbi:hypothetical protein GGI07_004462 [Coemansia sp. Benny D115]|nr:hypothetical protein GGI07_004462 [Coemansia sp. Benny D115]